jgi:hypothetical protein
MLDSFHHGFTVQAAVNLAHWFAVENYTGVYRTADHGYFVVNTTGGRVSFRNLSNRVVPFISSGVEFIPTRDALTGTDTAAITGLRSGGGVDIPLNSLVNFRVDVSHTLLRVYDEALGRDIWANGLNVSYGCVFKLDWGPWRP